MSTPTRVYTPDPGTTPDRALAWLRSQPVGTEVSTSALAASAGVPHGGLTVAMQPALKAGLVFARQKGGHVRSPLFWSLVDHSTAGAARSLGAELASVFQPLPKGLRSNPVVYVEKPGPRGSAAEPRNDNDDNESDSGRARRLAGGSDDGGSRADRGGDGRARDGVDDRGAAARGAVLLRAQPPRAAHQGTAGASDGGRVAGAVASAVGDDLTQGGLASPLVGRTATISMTGEVAVVAECGTVILFDAQRGRQLVQWLAGRAA